LHGLDASRVMRRFGRSDNLHHADKIDEYSSGFYVADMVANVTARQHIGKMAATMHIVRLLMACLVAMAALPVGDSSARELTPPELTHIAQLIFHNECAGQVACLTSWNRGEAFASLGIGHFIWYPRGASKHFHESFPELLQFMQRQGATLPTWLTPTMANPWRNRAQFLAAQDVANMRELRHFLAATQALQARFMQQRLQRALPEILQHAKPADRPRLRRQFERVAAAPMGMYVLIDYVNFKGEGTDPRERYHGHGWGLLQVLQQMPDHVSGREAIEAFAATADRLLTQRVALSPPERHEGRWLPGWRKRLATYSNQFFD